MSGKLFRQSLVYSLARLLPAAIAIPAIAIYTRLLTPMEYGSYIATISVVGFAHSATLSWLWITALRLFSGARQPGAFLLAIALCYTTILTIAGLGSIVIYTWTSTDGLLVFLGFIIFAVLGWSELNMYLLRAHLEAGRYFAMSISRAVFSTAASVALVAAGAGAFGILSGTIIGSGVTALWLTFRSWRELAAPKFNIIQLREILSYGLPLGAGFVSEATSANSDRLLLTALQQAETVGLYGAASSIAARIVTSTIDPIGTAGFSLAVRALEKEGQRAAATQLRNNFLLLIAIGLPVVAGLIVAGPDVTALLVGPEFRETAARLLPIMVVSCFLISLRRQYCEVAFHLARKTGSYARTMSIIAVLGVASGYILIQEHGSEGAAYAMLITHSLGFALTFYIGSRVFPLPVPFIATFKIVLATIAMAAIANAVPGGHGIVSLLTKASVGAITYFCLLFVLNVTATRSTVLGWLRHIWGPTA